MMTVNEMSKRTGVSVRTLHYYDQIGLLKPEAHTAGGYRLYGEKALERLGCILMYRELQFPLQSIAAILDSPAFDRNRALRQQIELLEMQKEHLETLILMARGVLMKGTEGGYLMTLLSLIRQNWIPMRKKPGRPGSIHRPGRSMRRNTKTPPGNKKLRRRKH